MIRIWEGPFLKELLHNIGWHLSFSLQTSTLFISIFITVTRDFVQFDFSLGLLTFGQYFDLRLLVTGVFSILKNYFSLYLLELDILV